MALLYFLFALLILAFRFMSRLAKIFLKICLIPLEIMAWAAHFLILGYLR